MIPGSKRWRLELKDAAAALLTASERCARGDGGLAVRPRKGRCVVFYTRGAEGGVDSSSFHFGAAVRTPRQVKWTCQIFKALPEVARESEDGLRAFMRRVHPREGESAAEPALPMPLS